MPGQAADLSRRLAEQAEAVCRHYLSNGRRQGRYWLVGDVANTPGRSLYVRLGAQGGAKVAGKWTDAATGEHGDLLDIIRLSCSLSGPTDAMDEARRFLALPCAVPRDHGEAPKSFGEGRQLAARQLAARRLYAMGRPLRGTLAEHYLRLRGVTADLRVLPLRFHPACYHLNDHGRCESRPALLAAVTDLAGVVTGVHRTWLDPAHATKAPLATPRKAMGCLLGHGVRFGVGRYVLIAGEGLETMLSLRTVMARAPMVAALSAAHLAALCVPPDLRRLYVAVDDDRAGRRALARLRERRDLSDVELHELAPGLGDFNEDLRLRGPEALMETLVRQLAPEDVARFAGARRAGDAVGGSDGRRSATR